MKWSLLDAITALALAAAIHRTNAGVVAAAHNARKLVARCSQPTVAKFINAPDPFDGIWRVVEQME